MRPCPIPHLRTAPSAARHHGPGGRLHGVHQELDRLPHVRRQVQEEQRHSRYDEQLWVAIQLYFALPILANSQLPHQNLADCGTTQPSIERTVTFAVAVLLFRVNI